MENIQSFSPFNVTITNPDSILESSLPQLLQPDDNRALSSSLEDVIGRTNSPTENPEVSNFDQFNLEDGLSEFSEIILTKQNHPDPDIHFNLCQDQLFEGNAYKDCSITIPDDSTQRVEMPNLNFLPPSKMYSANQGKLKRLLK